MAVWLHNSPNHNSSTIMLEHDTVTSTQIFSVNTVFLLQISPVKSVDGILSKEHVSFYLRLKKIFLSVKIQS